MAIGINLRDEVTVILPNDDAIASRLNGDSSEVEHEESKSESYYAYQESGYDESKLKIEGEPTRFRLRRMSYDQRKRSEDITSSSERVEYIVRCCLAGVTGLKCDYGDGRVVDIPPPEFDSNPPMVKLSWLRESNLPPSVLVFLAAAGKQLSECNVPFPGK